MDLLQLDTIKKTYERRKAKAIKKIEYWEDELKKKKRKRFSSRNYALNYAKPLKETNQKDK